MVLIRGTRKITEKAREKTKIHKEVTDFSLHKGNQFPLKEVAKFFPNVIHKSHTRLGQEKTHI